MKTKSIIVSFLFINLFAFGQISNNYIAGIYDVTIIEYNCSVSTNTQVGELHLILNTGCLNVRDSSYTTGYWFISNIIIKVNPDSTFSECTSCCLANGKYFPGDSIHLFIHYYIGSQCVHEYFGKRKTFTGVEDLKLLKNLITISPQPANEELFISNPNNVIIKSPKIFDMNGKQINIEFIKEENYKSDVAGLGSGIYFLNIETTAGLLRKKVIIYK